MDIKELLAELAKFDEMEAPDGLNILESEEVEETATDEVNESAEEKTEEK